MKDYNEMVMRWKPLGFSDVRQFDQFCNEMCDVAEQSFKESGFDNTNAFSLVISGTGANFYTENPTKPDGRHFDIKKNRRKPRFSDIDVAIIVENQTLLKQILTKFEEREENDSMDGFLKTQQFSQVDTRTFLNLDSFNRRWGIGGYQKRELDEDELANCDFVLKREVGIVLFKGSGTPTTNTVSKQQIVFSAIERKNRTALFGIQKNWSRFCWEEEMLKGYCKDIDDCFSEGKNLTVLDFKRCMRFCRNVYEKHYDDKKDFHSSDDGKKTDCCFPKSNNGRL